MPFSPLYLFIFLFLLGTMVAFIHLGILTIAFEKLGLSQSSAVTLLFMSLLGSAINLPLFTTKAQAPPPNMVPKQLQGLLRHTMRVFEGKTIIAVNVGGAIVPLMFSVYLLSHSSLHLGVVLVAIALVSVVCYLASRPVPGIGIGMNIFVGPISAAFVAVLLDGDQSAPLAYICGTMGVLVGADLLRLPDIRRMGAPLAAIGGAGTFDGIFITGIVAVLLA